MSESKTLLPLVAIVGPTASGKSALGVKIAERLGGEVVACDSTQLYRGFDIGTAKPSPSERRGIPHHLMDVLSPKEEATAGGYRQLALSVLDGLRQRKRLPIFTAGTGLYLRALLEGLAPLFARLNVRARVALCGLISDYQSREPRGWRNVRSLLVNRIKLQGFIAADHLQRWPAALAGRTTVNAPVPGDSRDTSPSARVA